MFHEVKENVLAMSEKTGNFSNSLMGNLSILLSCPLEKSHLGLLSTKGFLQNCVAFLLLSS